jgi:hypothetical protein
MLTSSRKRQTVPTPEARASTPDATSFRPGSAEHRQLHKAAQSLERKIVSLEKRREEVVVLLHAADPTDHVALQPLGEELRQLQAELVEAEETWLEWSEQLGT